MQMRHLTAAKVVGAAALKGNIKYFILHVNSVCNAKCRMCFSWDGMMERWDAKGHSMEEIDKLAASMYPLPQLTVSGGEPLLRKDLPEILQSFYDNAGTRMFTIPTNSLQPDRVERMIGHFIEHCPNGFLNFCLPFHGVEEHFDNIMGVPGNYQKFKKTYRVVQSNRAKHDNISCVLNFVMSKFNYTEYETIIDLAYEEFPEAPIGIAYCRGITHENDATDVPIEIYQDAQAYLARRKKNHTRFNPYTIMFDSIGEQLCTIISDVVTGDTRDLHCGAGKHFLVAYDNGMVYPCELLETVGMPKPNNPDEIPPTHHHLGDLHDFDYDMGKLLSSPRAQDLTRWIATHECACSWECAVYSKIVHSPKELATLSAKTLQYMFKPTAKRPAESTLQN